METKVCTKCGEEKPATSEYFAVDKRSKSGLRSNCKECVRQYDKNYRKENKDMIVERQRKYYEENKERITERNKKYREENKEYFKRYYAENREYHKQYYEDNKEHYGQYYKQHRKENKELYRSYNQKRRSLKRSLPSTLTINQWRHAQSYFNHSCAYCGRKTKLTQDHFWPLSRGGGYAATNIIPACLSCNSSKHNNLFEEWYPTHESYSHNREAKIYRYFEQLALENGEQGI